MNYKKQLELELQELQRDLSLEKQEWRRTGKGIQFDNIQAMRKKEKEIKDELDEL